MKWANQATYEMYCILKHNNDSNKQITEWIEQRELHRNKDRFTETRAHIYTDFMVKNKTGLSPAYAHQKVCLTQVLAKFIHESNMSMSMTVRNYVVNIVSQYPEEDYFVTKDGEPLNVETVAPEIKPFVSKEKKMKKVETQHLYGGKDITTMDNTEQFSAIIEMEKLIDKLKGIKTKSTKVESEIKRLEKALKKFVKVIDGS